MSDKRIEHMNHQARYGDPPACEWRSPEGMPCLLERHEGNLHITLKNEQKDNGDTQ